MLRGLVAAFIGLPNEAVEKPTRATSASPAFHPIKLSTQSALDAQKRHSDRDALAVACGPFLCYGRLAEPATFSMLWPIVRSFHCALSLR